VKKASWIILTVMGAAIVLISMISAYHSYSTSNYGIGDLSVSKVAGGDAELETALRGIRGTSASYAIAYGVLFLAVVLGPYRRGEVWAWKALFATVLIQSAFVFLRVPFLGTWLGTQAAITSNVPILIALLLDAGRLKSSAR
jgi:hypothetical protein